MKRIYGSSLVFLLSVASAALADGLIIPMPPRPGDPFPPALSVKYHHVDIRIRDQVAQTDVDQVFVNNFHRDIEGTYIFPVPEDVSISKFSMFVGNEEITGKILDKDEARRIYRDIVRRKKDPALLEYFQGGMFKASVYPIPAHGETRIKLRYSEVLKLSGGVCGYRYTLNTEKFSRDPLETVKLTIDIRSRAPIKSVYSPTHDVRIDRKNDFHAMVTYVEEHSRPDRDFLLYYTVSEEKIGFNLLAYEDGEKNGEGYFLAMIAPQVEVPADRTTGKDIVFVLDTSGSMQGEKIRQAKGALSFCLGSLNEGDRFNVIDFDDEINSFRDGLVSTERGNIGEALTFVEGCDASGGTNINDAVLRGLYHAQNSERTSFIIFLTDGLPTVGETSLDKILSNVKAANRSETRIFIFGVGYDVNTHFLDRLGEGNHAVSDYVRPSEDIEVKVSGFYKKISNPILTDIKLSFGELEVSDLYPKTLPDIFKGSQLYVSGRYRKGGITRVTLTGSADGKQQRFTYEVNLSSSSRNVFIPRLWATRRIGYLTDQVRLRGSDDELVEEIVRLSKKYGIITEYTSFLVDVDYTLSYDQLAPMAGRRIAESAEKKIGKNAVDQSVTLQSIKAAPRAPQGAIDAEGKEQQMSRMIQMGNRTFYDRNGLWVDAGYEGKKETIKIKKFSDAYFRLLEEAPGVGKYLSLGDACIFLIEGQAVHISDEGKSTLSKSELKMLFPG